MDESSQVLDTPEDAGKGPQGDARRWLIELELAHKSERVWRRVGAQVIRRYRGDQQYNQELQPQRDTFNVLWSNVETMRPTLYNTTPIPVVERRYKDADPIARAASLVLQRALQYTLSCQDMDQIMNLAVQDLLLPGRAAVRVRYVPTFSPAAEAREGDEQGDNTAPSTEDEYQERFDPAQQEQGEEAAPAEELVYEEIAFDLVDWEAFRRGPGRTWADVPWIAFGHRMTQHELVERFGQVGYLIPLTGMDEPDQQQDRLQLQKEEAYRTALVYEIWDKRTRKILYVCEAYPDRILDEREDNYQLANFFPLPRPMYAVETSGSLVPVPEFTLYQMLADELETLTNRMAKIARAIRARGIYAGDNPAIERVLQGDECELIPVQNADEWAERGGLEKAIWFLPLEMLTATLTVLSQQRDKVKEDIFEALGIADIMRGSSDARETYGAQAIKHRWGSLRLRRRQAEVQRFCRDLLNLAGELIAEKFSSQTLRLMTGLTFPVAAEKAQAQAQLVQLQQLAASPQAAQAPAEMQQAGQERMKALQELLALPTWEEIEAFLRNDSMRHFRIDIQTDSTVALQEADQQEQMAAMMGGLAQFMGGIMPLVKDRVLPFDAAKSMLLGLVRKFRVGTDIEAQLDAMVEPHNDPMQSPEAIKAQVKAQVDLQAQQARAQADMQIAQAKAQAQAGVEAAQAQADMAVERSKLENEAQLAQVRMQLELLQHKAEQDVRLRIAEIDAAAKVEAARVAAAYSNGAALVQQTLGAVEERNENEVQDD